mgnify:FL=1
MDYDKLIKEVEDIQDKSDFIISWFAKKYQKTIFRIGSMDKDGCRVWEDTKGNKLICFWDVVINRYTTAINPMITYKKARN